MNDWAHMTVGFTQDKENSVVRRLNGHSTPRIAVETLLEREHMHKRIWEPAAGLHAIANVLRLNDYTVFTSDIHRWHPRTQIIRSYFDFKQPVFDGDCDVMTNPPFSHGYDFAIKSLQLLPKDATVAMLLRLQFLEGINRKLDLFDNYRPYRVYVYSFRLPRTHLFHYKGKKSGGVMALAWFVWKVGWYKSTEIRWI